MTKQELLNNPLVKGMMLEFISEEGNPIDYISKIMDGCKINYEKKFESYKKSKQSRNYPITGFKDWYITGFIVNRGHEKGKIYRICKIKNKILNKK